MAGIPTRLGHGAPALRAHPATGAWLSLVQDVRWPFANIGAHMPRMSCMSGMPTRLGRGAPALGVLFATGGLLPTDAGHLAKMAPKKPPKCGGIQNTDSATFSVARVLGLGLAAG